MAMVGLLVDLQRIHQWRIHIWHGDHSWHKGSKRIGLELKQWCTEKNLPIYVSTAQSKETKNEAKARQWRYQELFTETERISSLRPQEPCQNVLTAHTANDRAETLILNLARGTDLAGLSSLHKSRQLNEEVQDKKVNLSRPMLCFSREDTLAICKELDLPIWIDPANQMEDFSRNKIRIKILPLLELLYPACTLRISKLSERLQGYKESQETLAKIAIRSLKNEKGLKRPELASIPSNARILLLASWLKEKRVPKLTSKTLEDISWRIGKSKPPGSKSLADRWYIIWDRETILLERREIVSDRK